MHNQPQPQARPALGRIAPTASTVRPASRAIGRPSTAYLWHADRALRAIAASARLDAMPSPKDRLQEA